MNLKDAMQVLQNNKVAKLDSWYKSKYINYKSLGESGAFCFTTRKGQLLPALECS
jgi:hypothetical protein